MELIPGNEGPINIRTTTTTQLPALARDRLQLYTVLRDFTQSRAGTITDTFAGVHVELMNPNTSNQFLRWELAQQTGFEDLTDNELALDFMTQTLSPFYYINDANRPVDPNNPKDLVIKVTSSTTPVSRAFHSDKIWTVDWVFEPVNGLSGWQTATNAFTDLSVEATIQFYNITNPSRVDSDGVRQQAVPPPLQQGSATSRQAKLYVEQYLVNQAIREIDGNTVIVPGQETLSALIQLSRPGANDVTINSRFVIDITGRGATEFLATNLERLTQSDYSVVLSRDI